MLLFFLHKLKAILLQKFDDTIPSCDILVSISILRVQLHHSNKKTTTYDCNLDLSAYICTLN